MARIGLFVLAAVVAATFSGIASAPAAAQDEDTGTVGDGGSRTLFIAAGSNAGDIRVGQPATPGTYPIVRCDLQLGDYGEWWTGVTDWSVLVVGNTYWRRCQSDTPGFGGVDQIIWDPADPGSGDGATNLDVLAELQKTLTPPAIQPELNPEDRQITGVETWFSLPDDADLQPAIVGSVGAIEVRLRADFNHIVFDVGEPGVDTFECDDFEKWTGGAGPAPCGHTYLTEPAGGSYPVATNTSWTFAWLDHGAVGWVLLNTVTPAGGFDVVVDDLEAVITAK